tara:strand:- start:147 stop:896 length:750 start_codon:yes stop_codon:yes gene_type:complete
VNKYIIITARSDSSRLKNKILAKITKKYLAIDIIIQRAMKINKPICLATSQHKSDDKLVNYVKKNYKIDIFRGDQNNKISRWIDCIKKFNIDYAALIDGDDLAFDFLLYKKYLKKIDLKNKVFKFNNDIIPGSFTYIFSSKDLNLLHTKSKKVKKVDVIEYFLKYLSEIKEINSPKYLIDKNIRLTLDYKDDLKFFRALYRNVNILEKTSNIVKFLEKNVKIKNINYHLEELWKKNQLKEVYLHEKKFK